MATGGRKTQLQVIHCISRTINYSDPAAATGQLIGILPAGAVLDKTIVLTSTAFNGSVTVTLSVGTTLTGTGYVNATDDFSEHPQVINGASDLLLEIFGEKGKHTRTAVGVSSLPLGVSVELNLVVEVEGN